jgi:hypothetical protein
VQDENAAEDQGDGHLLSLRDVGISGPHQRQPAIAVWAGSLTARTCCSYACPFVHTGLHLTFAERHDGRRGETLYAICEPHRQWATGRHGIVYTPLLKRIAGGQNPRVESRRMDGIDPQGAKSPHVARADLDSHTEKFYRRQVAEKLIRGEYVNDFASVVLTQQVADNPIVYSGPGTIDQDDSGELILKVYHVYSESTPPRFLNDRTRPGKLIGKERYFHLEATDMSGKEWFADNVWVLPRMSFPSAGTVLRIEIDELQATKDADHSDRFDVEMIIIGEYETPHSEFVALPDGSTSRMKHSMNLSSFSMSTVCTDTALYVQFSGEAQFYRPELPELALEAVGVATGHCLRPSAITTKALGKTTSVIRNVKTSGESSLAHPLRTFSPRDGKDFTEFIDRYFASFKEPWSVFYMNWYKISSSAGTSIENIALVQCVAIEGVLTEYFPAYGAPTESEIASMEKSVAVVNDADMDCDMRKRIVGLIATMRNQSPRKALKDLRDAGCISDGMVRAWNQRNSLAHGRILSAGGLHSIQDVLDDSNTVLSLFYKLLLLYIGYSGRMYDYTPEGWTFLQAERQGG